MTIFKGATAGFEAAVASSSPVSFQWRFNGNDIPGATNDLLSLTNVQFAQTGPYSVIASNELGVATSPEATLNVISVAAWGDPYPSVTNPPALAAANVTSRSVPSVAPNVERFSVSEDPPTHAGGHKGSAPTRLPFPRTIIPV